MGVVLEILVEVDSKDIKDAAVKVVVGSWKQVDRRAPQLMGSTNLNSHIELAPTPGRLGDERTEEASNLHMPELVFQAQLGMNAPTGRYYGDCPQSLS